VPAHPPNDLDNRTFQFASDAYDFCEELVGLGGLARRIGYQLFDAASSVGANREEAKSAYSRREFAHKNAISLKECREARFWLRIAAAKSLGNKDRRAYLLGESNQLISIFTASVRNLTATRVR
jgi:four helix bundle protein